MDKGPLVRQGAVRANEDVLSDGLPEYFYLEDVTDDLLRVLVDVWVDEGNVIVTGDDVAEGGELLVDTLDFYFI